MGMMADKKWRALTALLLAGLTTGCVVVEASEDDNRDEAIDGIGGASSATGSVGGNSGTGGTPAPIGAGGGGTTNPPPDDPPPPIDCKQALTDRGISFAEAGQPMDTPDGLPNVVCTIQDPIRIDPVIAGVAFHESSLSAAPTSMFTACANALAMVDAAELLAGMGVTDVVHYGIYNCRTISGTSTLSEHARANALDYAGFKLDTGAYYTVLDDWEPNNSNPTTPGGKMLHDFASTLFSDGIYTIILTPNFNDAHADHLHCDLTPGASYFD
jgi:hypothetical protein